MTVDIWEDDDGYTGIVSGTFVEHAYLFEGTPRLVTTIEGDNWEDCMKKYHRFMGWEEYKPVKL